MAEVPQQIFLGTLAQSAVLIAAARTGGRLSDRTGRRKIFVFSASIVYGLALLAVAIASNLNGFLVGMAISGPPTPQAPSGRTRSSPRSEPVI